MNHLHHNTVVPRASYRLNGRKEGNLIRWGARARPWSVISLSEKNAKKLEVKKDLFMATINYSGKNKKSERRFWRFYDWYRGVGHLRSFQVLSRYYQAPQKGSFARHNSYPFYPSKLISHVPVLVRYSWEGLVQKVELYKEKIIRFSFLKQIILVSLTIFRPFRITKKT